LPWDVLGALPHPAIPSPAKLVSGGRFPCNSQQQGAAIEQQGSVPDFALANLYCLQNDDCPDLLSGSARSRRQPFAPGSATSTRRRPPNLCIAEPMHAIAESRDMRVLPLRSPGPQEGHGSDPWRAQPDSGRWMAGPAVVQTCIDGRKQPQGGPVEVRPTAGHHRDKAVMDEGRGGHRYGRAFGLG
jgi:hypothetical protein